LPATDREVFEYFRSDPDTPVEVDNLAYASYAFDKYEWMKRFEEINGSPPTAQQENDWINQLPKSRLDEIRTEAYRFFDYAAKRYMKEEIEEAKEEAINSSILDEVKRATSFWSTFFPNLFIGVVASLAFSFLVIACGYIFNDDPSPIGFFKSLIPPAHVITNPQVSPLPTPTPQLPPTETSPQKSPD